MKQFTQKPTSLNEVKSLFPELRQQIDSLPAMTQEQTNALLAFFGEAVGQIKNYRQRAASAPSDAFGIISAISAYAETNVDISKIPAESKARQGYLKDLATAGRNAEGERISKTGIISIMASIITNDKSFHIYEDAELTNHFCNIVNTFANVTEKELFGYTISKAAREQFLEAESFAKKMLNVKVMPTTPVKSALTDEQKLVICRKYSLAIGDIIREIEKNPDISTELKAQLKKDLEAKIPNIAKVIGGSFAMTEYMSNIAKYGDLQPAIDELIKQSKHLTTISMDKDTLGRSNRILKAFGEAMKGHDPQHLAWVFQTVIPKMKVSNVEDLMKEPNKSYIFNAIKASEQFHSTTKAYDGKTSHIVTTVPTKKVEIITKVDAKIEARVEATKPAPTPITPKLETKETPKQVKVKAEEKIDFFKKEKHHHHRKKRSHTESHDKPSKKEYKGIGLTAKTRERDKIRHELSKEGLPSRHRSSDSSSGRSR